MGRIFSGIIVNRLGPNRLLRVSWFGIATGAVLIWSDFSHASNFIGLVLTGLFAAPVFPTLIATTPERLGATHTSNGVGFQIAFAVLGASIIPAAIGIFARMFSLEILCPVLLSVVALLIMFFEMQRHLNPSVKTQSQFKPAL
jgi:fucose permease